MWSYIREMALTESICQEKKKEEDWPGSRDSVDTSIGRLEENIKKVHKRQITATRNKAGDLMINRSIEGK